MTKFNYGLDNDSKGKLHEILVAKLLDPYNRFPQRPNEITELGLASEELHRTFVNRLGGEHTYNYEKHLEYAKVAVENIRKHFNKIHFTSNNCTVVKIFWTSNPNDVKALSPKDDKNTSDLVIEHKPFDVVAVNSDEKYVGLSLKIYGVKKINTLANVGVKTLDNLLNVNTEDIHKNTSQQVRNNTSALGFDISGLTIRNAHKLEKTDKNLLETNTSIMNKSIENVSKIYKNKLREKDSTNLENIIKHLVIPKKISSIKTYVVSTYGTKEIKNTIEDLSKDGTNILKKHKGNISIKTASSSNRNIIFCGMNQSSLLTIYMKAKSSGGFTTITGVVRGWYEQGK